uniref:F-box protein n=1 Tax=Noccaea caerulescens TaxID=107243 RepID=A0A1J3IWC1_NOCCA
MAHLPMDIISDLFILLPATTLVRCRVVSKPCFSLIDNPDFVASHLKRNVETGDHLMILLRAPRVLRTVYLDSPDNKVSDVDHPLQSGGFTEVFGSVNGLVGLTNSPVDMALFNPSTRKIHRLPIEPVEFPDRLITHKYVLYGLGYDLVNEDYKVVRMIQRKKVHHDDMVGYEIKVFSLKRNSWKSVHLQFEVQIKFFYFYYHVLYRRQNGVQVRNSLNWILPRGNRVAINTIIRLDLASEEFEFVFYPRDLFYENKMDLCVLDGCLCIMSYNELPHVDVWIKREYEPEGSWSKLFRVTKPEGVESLDFVRPLMLSKDKSKVLLEINVGKLVWFDLASGSFETLGIKDCEGSCSAEILVSSLVLGCKGDPHRAREKKMMHKSNNKDGFLSKGFKLKL